jgi:hypothetical protein
MNKHYHSYRNSKGQFATRPRSTNRAARAKQNENEIVPGRLYAYKDITVRAIGKTLDSNFRRLVSFHKTLFGLVKDSELKKIGGTKVEKYLKNA